MLTKNQERIEQVEPTKNSLTSIEFIEDDLKKVLFLVIKILFIKYSSYLLENNTNKNSLGLTSNNRLIDQETNEVKHLNTF